MKKNHLFGKYINLEFLLLFLMSLVNLLFLHYQFLSRIALEVDCFKSSYFDNLFACLLDVSFLVLLFWIITLKRLRLSLVITFVITLVWSFCNVFYSRFFQQYLSWSSVGQADNLTDSALVDSIMAGFEPIDLFYPIMIVLFCAIWFWSRKHDIVKRSLKTLLILWTVVLCLLVAGHSLYIFSDKTVADVVNKTLFTGPKYDSMWPNWTVFHKGFFRKLLLEQMINDSNIELTEEQEAEIEKAISDHRLRKTIRTAPDSVKNVIFILVESYLSVTSDLVVDGQEITPYLNKLKRDSNVYFNPHMRPNVSIGESSDGQLIYMAGLLPLHAEITVGKAKNDSIIGLPKQLQKAYPDLKSLTIIPTNPTLWDQQAMTDNYGFDHLYSMLDYQAEMKDNDSGGFLTDGMIFSYASKKDESNTTPFCSLILTMSTHQPYEGYEEHGFTLNDPTLPQRYKNYLISCHYMDMQLGKYLEELKNKGLYDKSLIVIVADHDARPRYLDMEGKISDDIPVYFVNGGIDKAKAWNGECNQLDVYTTILDIMGIETKWRGLGHTLLNKDYQNSVTEKTQELSDWIVYGDYFKGKNIQ
ncbi:MAG: sulfatase-like hydrolase/transferase [Prevotella sp.]|nr:sulfatase-like hydrolase/transferase [Prevotella sp.]